MPTRFLRIITSAAGFRKRDCNNRVSHELNRRLTSGVRNAGPRGGEPLERDLFTTIRDGDGDDDDELRTGHVVNRIRESPGVWANGRV